jgi:hypothetical protein
MNVLKIAVAEGDLLAISRNIDLYLMENVFELFKDACSLGQLRIVKWFVEELNILDEPYLVPKYEFFEDPDGCGYVGHVALSLAAREKHYGILDYLLSQNVDLNLRAEFPSALVQSIKNDDYCTFSLLLAQGMRDVNDKCIREALKKEDARFFKILFSNKDAFEDITIESFFSVAANRGNYEIVFLLHEKHGLTLSDDHHFYEAFMVYKALMEKARTKAANKIRNWWGPRLRRINPEFVMREAEESWKRVEKMYEEQNL